MRKKLIGGKKSNHFRMINEMANEIQSDLGDSLTRREARALADAVLGDIDDGKVMPISRVLWEARKK